MTSASIAQPDATAIGTVSCVNDKGIKFEGASDWSNVSKYAEGIVMPAKGATVRVTFDRQGFIRAIAPADGQSAMNGTASPHKPGSDKDRTITRLAVLKAAAEYSASKPQSSSSDVLKIAASWERWVTRDTETVEDLIDAF